MYQYLNNRYLITAVVAALVLFPGLGSPRLWDRDEPRNAACARDMLEAADWVVPVFNGELRTHKPVMLYWLQMASYQCFGVSEWTARLSSAVLALGTVLSLVFLATSLQPRRTPLPIWSGVVLASSLMFIVAGRAATPDSCLIFFSTLGITCWVQTKSPHDQAKSRQAVTWWLIAGYTAFGCAVLSKGPVGIILPSAVLLLWSIFLQLQQEWNLISDLFQNTDAKSWRSFASRLGQLATRTLAIGWTEFLTFRPVLGLLIVILVAGPWYVLVGLRTDGVWLREFFLEHNMQRAMAPMEGHQGTILYYPFASLVGLFPWSIWLAPCLLLLWKVGRSDLRSRPLLSLGMIWVGIYITAFSFAGTKLPSYITPCYPGAALVLGWFIHFSSRIPRLPPIQRAIFMAAPIVLLLIGLGFTVGIPIVAQKEALSGVAIQAVWGIALIIGAALAIRFISLNQFGKSHLSVAGGGIVFLLGLFCFGASSASKQRADLDMLIRLDQEDRSGNWLAVGAMESSWVYYLDRVIPQYLLPPSVIVAAENDSVGNTEDADRWVHDIRQIANREHNLKLIMTEKVAKRFLLATQVGSQPTWQIVDSAPYFLQHENLVVLKAIESIDRAATRVQPVIER